MAHPPDKASNLSLEDFLGQVSVCLRIKVIKLDFKDLEVIEPSLEIAQVIHKNDQN